MYTYLDDDFSAPVQLAKLLCNRQHFIPLGDLVLRLQVVERSVDAAYLTVGPALNAVPPAEALERRHRNVHCLL